MQAYRIWLSCTRMLSALLTASVFLILASIGFFYMSSALDALKAQVAVSVASSAAAVAKIADLKKQVVDLSAQVASGTIGEQDLGDATAQLKAASEAETAAST